MALTPYEHSPLGVRTVQNRAAARLPISARIFAIPAQAACRAVH